MSQAQVEGKEKSQEEPIGAQGGDHPQHSQQLHTHWVSKVGKESQSPRRLQGQGLTQSQHMVINLLEAHQFSIVKDQKDAKDEEPGNNVEHKAEERYPGGPWFSPSLP